MFASTLATFIIAQTMSSNPSLEVSLEEYTCMVEAIHFEAKGEDTVGKASVANVILNRVDSPRFPDTICGVVKQEKQFSYRNDVDRPYVHVKNKIEEKSFRETTEIALWAVNGKLIDRTEGADHYYAHDKVEPFWITAAEYTKVIGNHTFAKL